MTREEAIKIIKSNCSCTDSKLREACAMFIPELAESEDEKIRQALLTKFVKEKNKGAKYSIHGCSLDSIITYLEKQKEFSEHGYGLYYYHNGGFTFVARPAIEEEKQKDNKFAPRVLPCSAAWFEDGEEQQKEQKGQNLFHIEDINYEENFDLAKNAVGMIRNGACYLCNRSRNEVLDWLENVPKIIKQLTIKINELEKQKAKEDYDRMAPIYKDKESFESALEKAWKFYNDSGASTVDGCEDNAIELAFAKGFREGFLCEKAQINQASSWDESRSYYDD